MTVFESFKANNIDELAEWLDKNISCIDETPWIKWWDNNYCNKCESEIVRTPYFLGGEREQECGWCELNDKCKYFQHLDDIPDNKYVIKLWLESENDIV